MVVAYSTTTVHPRDRASFWTEVIAKSLFRQEFSSPIREYFGAIRAGTLGRLRIVHGKGDACVIERSVRHTRDGADAFMVSFRVSGRTLVDQGGRETVQNAGTVMLTDTARPLRHTFPIASEAIVVTVPREALTSRLGNTLEFCTRPISTGSPVGSLASEFISLLLPRLDSLDQTASDRLAEQALDLIALAFTTELGQAQPTLSSPSATALLRLKAVIEARLSDPGLTPTQAAAAAGISVRYANDLLAEENFSVERYIMHRRLERCRGTLEDTLQAHRMIGDIAFGWSFSHFSHFTRRFRSAFGMTPSDCRRRALAGD